MRVHKTYSINLEVATEFEKSVPAKYRSRVLDVLMIKFLMEGVGQKQEVKPLEV